MTFGEMCDRVTAFIGLQEITDFDESVMVKSFVNQGLIDMLSRTRCVVRCVDMRVLAGVSEYLVGNTILGLVDIEDGLARVARASDYEPSFTMIRADILRVQPTPDEDGEIQVWAVKRPQTMVNDADDPSTEPFGAIPLDFQDAIVTYALWKCSDYADDQSGGNGERYRMLYEGQDGRGGRLAQIRAAVNKRGTSRAPRARVRLVGVRDSDHWAG